MRDTGSFPDSDMISEMGFYAYEERIEEYKIQIQELHKKFLKKQSELQALSSQVDILTSDEYQKRENVLVKEIESCQKSIMELAYKMGEHLDHSQVTGLDLMNLPNNMPKQ